METNPRTRPGEWAPPPAVVSGQPASSAPIPPRPVVRAEAQAAEFEATLGSLVERFTALPPPLYGEPPDLSLTEGQSRPRTAHRRSLLGTAVVALFLGGMVVAAALVGFRLAGVGSEKAVSPTLPQA